MKNNVIKEENLNDRYTSFIETLCTFSEEFMEDGRKQPIENIKRGSIFEEDIK